jgi:hypothetical protein
MKRFAILLALFHMFTAHLDAGVPFYESFNDRTVGNLHGQNGWQAANAVVQTSRVFEGTKAAEITNSAGYARRTFSGSATQVWTDFYYQSGFFLRDPGVPDSNATVLLYFDADGHPVAYDGTSPQVFSNVTVTAGEWVRVSVRSDYTSKRWDLYINAALVAADLGFYNTSVAGYTTFQIYGVGSSSGYLDEVRAQTSSPLSSVLVMAPSGLVATPASSWRVDLNWADNSNNETGFAIERSWVSGSGFVQIAAVTANVTSYSDLDVYPGVTYYYRVVATNATHRSAVSPEASVGVPKAASVVTVSGPAAYTFNGAPQGPDTLHVTGSSGAITLAYSGTGSTTYGPAAEKPTHAGTYQLVATVAEDYNYNGGSSAPYSFTIQKALPVVTVWPSTSPIALGEPLASSALGDGVASLPGVFGFATPDLVPAQSGFFHTGIIFSPDESTNYANVTGSVEVAVIGKSTIPFVENFEERRLGDLYGQNNWWASNAVVQTDSFFRGQKATELLHDGSMLQAFTGTTAVVLWTDLYYAPEFAVEELEDLDPLASVLFYFNVDGYVVAYDGQVPVVLTNMVPVAEGAWVRVTARHDYQNRTWDLFVNEALAARGLGFYNSDAGNYQSLQIKGASARRVFVDDIRITEDVPSDLPLVRTLTVISQHGQAEPVAGQHIYLLGDWVHARISGSPELDANPKTQYVANGWNGTGSVPVHGTGTNVSFEILQDTTLQWLWTTNHWVDIMPRR